ncbi:hypothetical protein [Ensifer soli]|uniref:hypothetical protein n=1 Tax=Ciceribacter sp. sgz301302 TaxID=3342379 RepID=UPI0035BAF8FD
MPIKPWLTAFALAAVLFGGPARADALIEEYNAYIGEDDLYSSGGQRLGEPWQIIRQDRANVHRFGIRQRGDEGDAFFGSAKNRERAERMIARGRISANAAAAIYQGDVMINVRIYRGRGGDYLAITVY